MSTTYDWSPVFQAIQGFADQQKYKNILGSLFGQPDVTPAQSAGQINTPMPSVALPGSSVQPANPAAKGASAIQMQPLQIGGGQLSINTPALPAQTTYNGPVADALGHDQTASLLPLLKSLGPSGMPLLLQTYQNAMQHKQEMADKKVTPLTDDQAAALGLRKGGVYGRDAFGNVTTIQAPDTLSQAAVDQKNAENHITPLAPNDPRMPPPNARIPGAVYGVDASGNVTVTKLGDAKSQLAQQQDEAARAAAAAEQARLLSGGTPAPGAPGGPQLDPNSNNLSAQTGLSQGAINLLTGQTKGQRMTSAMSMALNREIQAWGIKNGVNTSTMIPQATGAFNVLQNNIQRNNQAGILENEIMGSAGNLAPILDAARRGNVNKLNVAKAWAGEQVNDQNATQIADQTARLRDELASYNAVAGGHLMENGTPAPTPEDYKAAERVITDGLNSGTVNAITDSVRKSAAKNSVVLQNSIDQANENFFKLFGATYHRPKAQGGGSNNPPPPPPPSGAKVRVYNPATGRLE